MIAAPFSLTADTAAEVPEEARAAQVVFLGEQHDNPAHHAVQAEWVATLKPTAVVFEMLTPAQAYRVTAKNRQDAVTLAQTLDWESSGWPDFLMYYPIFEAAPQAEIFGAGVPRENLRAAMQEDVFSVFGADAAAQFGLDQPLPEKQQELREALQRAAHCDALPEALLPRMVDVQRLRDATLAQAALEAVTRLGAPVVVITGNGHAREDWGAPALLRLAAPDITVFSLGQGEAGEYPEGGFGFVLDGPAVDRGDPCDAFK